MPSMILKDKDIGFSTQEEALEVLEKIKNDENLNIPIKEYKVTEWQNGWAIVTK